MAKQCGMFKPAISFKCLDLHICDVSCAVVNWGEGVLDACIWEPGRLKDDTQR
jgi:hypothetical protein